jgi:protein-L-isoaspartate(D-aspartate) O-methyltransferase
MPRAERLTGVTIPGIVPFDLLLLWLATHLDGSARIAVDSSLDTGILERPGGWDAAALVRDDSLAHLLTRELPANASGENLREFGVHAQGPHADELAQIMADLVVAWDRDARRSTGPQLTVHPAGTADHQLPTGHVLDKPHSRLTFAWTPDTP